MAAAGAGGEPGAVTGGALVLLVVLVIGVLAGRARLRWLLLLAGLVAVAAIGVVAAGMGGLDLQGPRDATAARLAALYAVVLPPGVAFLAGWLCGRGTWMKRLVVLGVAALLLASFPYAAAAAATADALIRADP